MHGRAKEQIEIGSEKEVIGLATMQAVGKNKDANLEQTEFQNEIDNVAGKDEAKVYVDDEDFLVVFKSGRAYTVDKKGNVTNMQMNYQKPKRKLAYELNDNNYGTEDNPYEINCIEDLVELSYQVNGIQIVDGKLTIALIYENFEEKNFILNRNLNFASELSYEDASRKDYGDINGNGQIETLLKELTSGTGWVPIGGYDGSKNGSGFEGIFNGNGKTIRNLYINNEEKTSISGLFGGITGATIKDLGVLGKIYCNSSSVGGIIGSGTAQSGKEINIDNCFFNGTIENINTGGNTGGIGGYLTNATININKCYCIGSIKGNNSDGGSCGTGGIVANSNRAIIKNCYNESNIIGYSRVGGLVGNNGNEIYDSYNKGEIKGGQYVGGIVGYTAKVVERCYNTGKIMTTGNYAGGIAGAIYAGGNQKIYQCYNTGRIEGKSNIGGILGRIYSAPSLMIEQCYNTAIVVGTDFTAGIVGCIAGSNSKILNCYNIGEIQGNTIAGIAMADGNIKTAKVVSCYNTANLSATTKYGVLPKSGSNGVTYNSYYLSSCGATDTIATAISENEFKNITSTLDKDFTIDDEQNTVTISEEEKQEVWSNDENKQNDGYPILKWQTLSFLVHLKL